MSFVSEQAYIANVTALGSRLQTFESRLNELFEKVESKFTEQHSAIDEINARIPVMVEQMTRIGADAKTHGDTMESKVSGIIVESRDLFINRAKQLEDAHVETTEAVKTLNQISIQTRADLNAMAAHGGAPTQSGKGGHRKLIDAKNFTLKVFDGDRDSKNAFDEWREDMQKYLETYYPMINPILDKAARWEHEIAQDNIQQIAAAAYVDTSALQWTYNEVNKDIFTFMKKYVLNRARKAFATSRNGGFDAYRIMVNEIDPINHSTKAPMTEAITGMVRK